MERRLTRLAEQPADLLPPVLAVLPFAVAVAAWPGGRVLAANQAWQRLAAAAGEAGAPSLAALFPRAGLAAEDVLQGDGAAAAVTLRALPLASPGGDAPTWWDLDLVRHPERGGALVVTAREVTAEVLARRDADAPAAVLPAPLDVATLNSRADDGALRRVMEVAGLATFEVEDPGSGAAARVSPAFRALYALPPEARCDYATILARVHPADRAAFQADHARLAREGGRFSAEFRILLPDGAIRWVQAIGTAEPGPGGMPRRLCGIGLDVTARKAAEAALAESEAQLRRVQRIGRLGGFEVDFRTGASRRSAEYMSLVDGRAVPAEEEHADWVRRLHPDDRERAERRFLDAVADDAPDACYAQDYRIVTPSGEIRWIAARAEIERDPATGRTLRMIGAHLDITDLKLAEAALRAREARLQDALRAGRVIAFDWTLATDRVRRMGDVTAILGRPVGPGAADTGAAYLMRVAEADRAALRAALDALTPAAPAYSIRYRYVRPDGRIVWLSETGHARFDAAGLCEQISGLARDVTAEVEAQEARAASEARFRALVEASGPIVFRAEPGSGIVSAPGWTLLTGQPETALRNEGWLERLHPDDRVPVVAAWRAALVAVQPVRVSYRVLTRENAWRWVETYAVPVRNAAGEIVEWVGTLVDIHDRRLAEEAAQRSGELLRMVIESTPDLVWAKDVEGRIILCNQAVLDLLGGGDAARVMGLGTFELFPDPAQARLVAENDARILASGRVEQVEEAVGPRIFQSIKAPWRDASGRAIGVVGVSRDVTAAREAEAALRRSEERLRLAQEAGGVGSWEWDIATDALHWSESCHRLHGTDPALPPSYAAWRAGIHPEDLPKVDAALHDALAGRSAGWDLEFRFTRVADGALRWIVGRGRILRDAATGQPVRAVGIGLDVTDRREAEERLRLLAREVDHRAKNALAVVQAAVRLAPKHDAVAFARTVEGRVAALAHAQALLTESGWRGAALRAVAEGALAAFLPPEDGATAEPLRVRLDGPELRLAAAATQPVSLALHELATNAAKYGALSAPGGAVSLSWELDRAGASLRLAWCESGGPALRAAPARRGFGSRIIAATVTDQLGGEVMQHWDEAGLRCELSLPAVRAVEGWSVAVPA